MTSSVPSENSAPDTGRPGRPANSPTPQTAVPEEEAGQGPSFKRVPSQRELRTAAGAGAIASVSGGAGAFLDTSASADVVWIVFLLLGALAVILAGVSAIARRSYVSNVLRLGLGDLEGGRADQVNDAAVRLTEAGAQQEAGLLLALKSQMRAK